MAPGHSCGSKGPRNRDLAGRRVITLAYGAQPFDQLQIAGEQRFLELCTALSPIVFGEGPAIRPRVIAALSRPEAIGE
jgi:hypothetical protein